MIEKVVGWALQKVVEEEVDDSVATAALVGVALDSAAFKAMGLPGTGAVVAGAVSGATPKIVKMIRNGGKK